MKKGTKFLIKYSAALVIASSISLLILWLRGFWTESSQLERYGILSDAFIVPGVLLILSGAFVWIGSDGFFDGIAYAFNKAGQMLLPFIVKHKHQNYYDYKKSKSDKRLKGYSCIFFVGLVFVIVAVVFLILYNSV